MSSVHRLLAALLAGQGFALLTACSATAWERGLYDGMREGAANAARQPGPRAVPQATTLPDHGHYERERQRLRGDPKVEAAPGEAAAASAAAR